MLAGCQVTAQVFLFTIILSIPLGLILAFGRVSNLSLVKHFIAFYVWVMRGTPLMLQLLFFYFALPSIGIRFDDFTAAMIAFVLNYAAYFCEIFRAGIQAIPKGQYEAGQVLGMTKTQVFFKIVLMQVVKNIIPPMSNEIITLAIATMMVTERPITMAGLS